MGQVTVLTIDEAKEVADLGLLITYAYDGVDKAFLTRIAGGRYSLRYFGGSSQYPPTTLTGDWDYIQRYITLPKSRLKTTAKKIVWNEEKTVAAEGGVYKVMVSHSGWGVRVGKED